MAGPRQGGARELPPTPFGEVFRRARLARGQTQQAAGDEMGVRQQNVGAWERGERPSPSMVPVIAIYLGVDEAEVVGLLDHRAEVLALRSAPPGAGGQPAVARSAAEVVRLLAESFAVAKKEDRLEPSDSVLFGRFLDLLAAEDLGS